MSREGARLKRAKNGYFYVVWSENGRSKRESTSHKERAAAESAFVHWLTMHRGGTPEFGAGLRVKELWPRYVEEHLDRKASGQFEYEIVGRHITTHFGDMIVEDIDQAVVDRYAAARRKGTIGQPSQDSTIRRELIQFRACLNWHADPRRKTLPIGLLPAFDLPRAAAPRERWLRHEEVQRLLDAARLMRPGPRLSRGELFLWLALETAARKTAILTLTWDRVDFETGVVHYRDPAVQETKKRRASVPISKALRPILERAWLERENDFVMGSKAEIWSTVQCIADRAGFGARAATVAKPLGRRSGAKPAATGISPHTLRHTAATHMARRGVPLWIIAKILGNTLEVVEKVYAKHSPEDLRDAVNLISAGALICADVGAPRAA